MKKLFLPGFIILFSLILLGGFSTSAFAFLGFNEGGGGSSLDCDEILKKITKGSEVVGEWGINPVGGFKYITDKKILNKQDQAYCYLYRGQAEDDIKGQYNAEEEIKIFYFTDSNSATAKLEELKKGERSDFKMKNSDELSYSGHTESEGQGFFEENGAPKQYSVDIPNYARTVRALGNCLTEVKYFDHMDRHGWSFKTRENFIWQVAEWYNGTTEGFDKAISTSEDILTFCGAKAPSKPPANQTVTTEKNSQKQPQSSPAQSKQDEGNLFKKALGGFPVFIGEWFKAITTGWGMGEFLYGSMAFGDEVLRSKERREIEEEEEAQEKRKIEAQQKLEDYFDKQGLADLDQVLNRIPVIKDSPDYKTGQWQQNSPFRLDILNGKAQIKYPGEAEWKDIKVGDKIPSGSTLFTGMDTTTVLSIRNKGVVQILPFTEITVTEEGLTDPSKTTTELDLRTGEIELNVEGGAYGASFQVFTTNAVAGVRGTHFWVSYNKDKKLSTVGVYKGEVEVKTSGNDKPTLVSPNGDPSASSGQVKPGVVVVASKLSVTKLAIAGAVLVVVLGGLILTFRKRFLSKALNKKKK